MYSNIQKYIRFIHERINKLDAFLEQATIKRIGFVIIAVFFGVLVCFFNWFQPVFGDDWGYSMNADGTRVRSCIDIFNTLYRHYFDWGGRIIVHIIAEVLLMLNNHVADIVNSLAYIGLILIIYKISNITHRIRPSLFLAINLLIWLFQPAFGSTVLWMTGSANYLWGTLIILLFIYPYINQIYVIKNHDSIVKRILFFLFGIIAGWTNENMVVALIFILIAFIVYYKVKQKKVPVWAVSGVCGVALGGILMIAAPGNYARMGAEITSRYANESYISILVVRFFKLISVYYYYVLAPAFIYLFTLCMYRAYRIKNDKPVLFISGVFFVGSIIATLVMVASPIFPARTTFGIIALTFTATGILYANMDLSKVLVKRLSYVILIFAFLTFLGDYYTGYRVLSDVNKHLTTRLAVIEEGKKNGQRDFVLEDRITGYENRYLHYFELTPDSTNWHNRMFSKFHGINSIIIK